MKKIDDGLTNSQRWCLKNKQKIHESYLKHSEEKVSRRNAKSNINAKNITEYMKKYNHLRNLKNKEQQHELSRLSYLKNKEIISDNGHKKYYNVKEEIFKLLGGRCFNPNCLVPNGCSDWRALQIDHINGGGHKEVRLFSNPLKYYKHILKSIKSGSKDYQLLCANCNQIKRYINKEGIL